MSLAKLPFLLSTALSTHVAWTSPNPPPPPNERVGVSTTSEAIFTHTVKRIPQATKIMVWIACLCEAAVIYCRKNPSSEVARSILSLLVVGKASDSMRLQATHRIGTNKVFYVGWTLACIGGLIRIATYRSLGRLFTYELSLRPGHHLVTSGLYSIVRHPSYTGCYLEALGAGLCVIGPGSWMQECGIWQTKAGRYLAVAWIGFVSFTLGNMFLRTDNEDKFLRKEFGKEWDEWAERVPYKLVPGIY